MSENRGTPPTARNDRTEGALNLLKGCNISAIPSSNERMGEKKENCESLSAIISGKETTYQIYNAFF
jgi:hypothetical protein